MYTQVTKHNLPKTVPALDELGSRYHATSCGRLRWKELKVEGVEDVLLEAVYLHGYLGPLSWEPYKGEHVESTAHRACGIHLYKPTHKFCLHCLHVHACNR